MVKRATTIQLTQNDLIQSRSNGIIKLLFITLGSALSVHILDPNKYPNGLTLSVLYCGMLISLNLIASTIRIMFLGPKELRDIPMIKIAINSISMTFLGIVVCFIATVIFSMWTKKKISLFVFLVFISASSYSPLIIILKFLQIFEFLFITAASMIMSFYANSSLYQVYMPRDQRESIIQSVLNFAFVIGIYTVMLQQ
ncbi:hypothetical protein NUSPORA_01911 [Nucleospora cyclopteri]